MRPLPPRAGLVLLLAALLLLPGCAAPEGGTRGTGGGLVAGTEASFPPFEDVDPATGEFVGFDIDLARAIAQRMNRTVEFRNLGFTALIPSVQSGQIDMAISAMTINEERQQQVDFSLPYYTANQSVAVRAGEEDIRAAEDLANRTIGVQLGTTAEGWLVENLVAKGQLRNASIQRYESFPLAVQALERGDVEAVMMDTPAVRAAVRERGGPIREAFQIDTGEQYGIALRKGNTELLLAVNDALRQLEASGELQQLRDRWSL